MGFWREQGTCRNPPSTDPLCCKNRFYLPKWPQWYFPSHTLFQNLPICFLPLNMGAGGGGRPLRQPPATEYGGRGGCQVTKEASS